MVIIDLNGIPVVWNHPGIAFAVTVLCCTSWSHHDSSESQCGNYDSKLIRDSSATQIAERQDLRQGVSQVPP
jgi:hypothetical protein